MEKWSPVPLAICEVCGLLWGVSILGTCAYAVFWLDHNGWWFVLAILITGSWTCKTCMHPDQLRALKELKEAEKD